MASRNFPSTRIMNFQHDGVLIAGSFSVTAGAITAGTIYGEGFTVARTGAGDYLVTTRDGYRHLVAFGSDLGLTTPNADVVTNCGLPGGGAGAVVTLPVSVHNTAAGLQADPAAAADRVSFWMLLSNHQNDAVR